MRFCESITAKVLVWLAAILVPVESLPVMACDCGSHSLGTSAVNAAHADAAPVAKCPHCASRERARHSCCGDAAVSSAQPCCCCGGNGPCHCCCCKHGGQCHCAANKSAPAPDPLPSNSRTDNTKSSLATSSLGGMATVAVLVPSAALTRGDQQPTLLCSSAPERLSILCRLVV